MSLAKRSDAYARHMDEVFMEHREEIEEAERIALLESEERYFSMVNVHDKVGTKEDIFGMLGRIFQPSQTNNKPNTNDNVDQRTK